MVLDFGRREPQLTDGGDIRISYSSGEGHKHFHHDPTEKPLKITGQLRTDILLDSSFLPTRLHTESIWKTFPRQRGRGTTTSGGGGVESTTTTLGF